jgi:gliding motility-associated-like protein
VYETPTSIFTINTDILEEAGVILETHNLSISAEHYLWHFGDSSFSNLENPTHKYKNNGNYNIRLIAYNQQCTDTSYKVISVRNSSEGSIIIPNSFTPNESNVNDGNIDQYYGINDIFHPVILGAKSYELDIFNRWGDHLFNSKDMKIGWNGYSKGRLCQQDVYIYKIKVVYLNNEEEIIVGQVTLIR